MMTTVEDIKVTPFCKIADRRGNLTVAQSGTDLPFEIQRAYWVYDVPGGECRGGHAHKECQEMIIAINHYELIGGCIPLGILSSCMALLFGFGKTKLTLLVNFCRVFVFRIPVLWALQNFTKLGSESVGITMMVSNMLVALLAAIVAGIVIYGEYKKYKLAIKNIKTA